VTITASSSGNISRSPITFSFSPNFSQIPLVSASPSASASPSSSFSFSAYTTMLPSPTSLWSPGPSYSSQPQPQPQPQPQTNSNGLSTNMMIIIFSILGFIIILSVINAIHYNQKYKLEKKKRLVEYRSNPLQMHSQVRSILPS
jgi:hypothetical protein